MYRFRKIHNIQFNIIFLYTYFDEKIITNHYKSYNFFSFVQSNFLNTKNTRLTIQKYTHLKIKFFYLRRHAFYIRNNAPFEQIYAETTFYILNFFYQNFINNLYSTPDLKLTLISTLIIQNIKYLYISSIDNFISNIKIYNFNLLNLLYFQRYFWTYKSIYCRRRVTYFWKKYVKKKKRRYRWLYKHTRMRRLLKRSILMNLKYVTTIDRKFFLYDVFAYTLYYFSRTHFKKSSALFLYFKKIHPRLSPLIINTDIITRFVDIDLITYNYIYYALIILMMQLV